MSLKKKLYSSFRLKARPQKEEGDSQTEEDGELVTSSPGNHNGELATSPSVEQNEIGELLPSTTMEQNEEIVTSTTVEHPSTESSGSEETAQQCSEKVSQDEVSVSASDSDSTASHTDEVTIIRAPEPSSLALPDGVAMDPLAPTALAVSAEFMDRIGSGLTLLRNHGKKVQKYMWKNRKFEVVKKSWKSIVNVVLVEARDLPDGPESGSNCIYCKFRLGSESHKSKLVAKTSRPAWRERFNLHAYDDSMLELTVWHKGKQKNFMGRCMLDLPQLERERTHELWQELECGFGSVHLLVTVSATMRTFPVDNVPTSNGVRHMSPTDEKFAWYQLDNWNDVGQLSVTVHGAKGLAASGIASKPHAFCVMELDNARLQTHTVKDTSEPNWNKTYIIPVNDITSTLEITINDESVYSVHGHEIGKVAIPLLRINNSEKRWYALKDSTKRSSAKGNCPRVLLELSVTWNPIKASLRVLSPKETKYIQKRPKFDIPLIYSNLKFIKDVFNAMYVGNEMFKRLFEWDSWEKSALALVSWLTFCYFIRLWMVPLLLLVPFLYHWTGYRSCNNQSLVPIYSSDEDIDDDDVSSKDDKTLKTRMYGLQDLTFTIKNGIDYIVSLFERVKNLANFTVPYLSFLAMTVLLLGAVVLYVAPVNYLFMAGGVYKFTRKFLRPDRIPNNDILDFISRVPDNEILNEWRELKVPEPIFSRVGSMKIK